MGTFRNDHDAALARADALERELAQERADAREREARLVALEAEVARLEAAPRVEGERAVEPVREEAAADPVREDAVVEPVREEVRRVESEAQQYGVIIAVALVVMVLVMLLVWRALT